MKTEQPILITSIKAVSEVDKHRFITAGGTQGTDEFYPLGVSNAATSIGEEIPVICYGIVLVETGAALAYSQDVMSDTEGKAIPSTNGNLTRGVALEPSSGANELIRILLK
jgi:hypothetical protein